MFSCFESPEVLNVWDLLTWRTSEKLPPIVPSFFCLLAGDGITIWGKFLAEVETFCKLQLSWRCIFHFPIQLSYNIFHFCLKLLLLPCVKKNRSMGFIRPENDSHLLNWQQLPQIIPILLIYDAKCRDWFSTFVPFADNQELPT